MTTDWLVNSNFGRIFGTAVGSANSNFGWSLLGKPARLPAAVNLLARLQARPPLLQPYCVRPWRSPAHSYERKPSLQPASNHALARACTTACTSKPNKLQAKHSALAGANESFDCLALEGSAPCGHTVAAGAGGGTAGPAGRPGSLIAVCVASVSGPSVRPGKSFAFWMVFGTRGASKRDAVSALNPQGEARTSRSAPNFGCPAANFWNTA